MLAASLAVTLFAAACGGSDGGGARTTSGGSAPAGEIQSGGRMVLGTNQGISQLNPYRIVAAWEIATYKLLWNGLVQYDEDGEIVGDLARSWKITDDSQTYTFKLKPGVTYTDGRRLTATDVVESLDYGLSERTAWPFRSYVPNVREIVAPDPQTVQIRLTRPVNNVLPGLTLAMIVDPETLDSAGTRPNGTGPYELKALDPNQRLVVTRKTGYWGEEGRLDDLELVRAQDTSAAVTSLITGDLDVFWQVPWADVRTLGERDDMNVVLPKEQADTQILMVDNSTPPFDDAKARQALAYAVDRDTIVRTVFADRLVVTPQNSPISPESSWFNGDLPEYGFDLDKARELFAEAGVTRLVWWQMAGFPEQRTMGQIVQRDLKTIGVDLEIKQADAATHGAKFAPAGKKWPGYIVPTLYLAPNNPGIFMSQWFPGICECNYDNPEYNDAVAAGAAASDPAVEREQYDKAQAIFAEDAPVTVIAMSGIPMVTRKLVTGVFTDGTGYPRFDHAGWLGE